MSVHHVIAMLVGAAGGSALTVFVLLALAVFRPRRPRRSELERLRLEGPRRRDLVELQAIQPPPRERQ